jgi:hypothetical protein
MAAGLLGCMPIDTKLLSELKSLIKGAKAEALVTIAVVNTHGDLVDAHHVRVSAIRGLVRLPKSKRLTRLEFCQRKGALVAEWGGGHLYLRASGHSVTEWNRLTATSLFYEVPYVAA